MKFTNAELQLANARRAARFPPTFNTENAKRKHPQRDGEGEENQSPKKKKMTESSQPGPDATTHQREESSSPKSPPCQPSPQPAHQTSTTPLVHQDRPQSSKPTANPSPTQQGTGGSSQKQVSPTGGEKEGHSNRPLTLRDSIDLVEFMLSGIGREYLEGEIFSKGIEDAGQECVASILQAGCIFAHAFKKYGASVAEVEKLRTENAELCFATPSAMTLLTNW